MTTATVSMTDDLSEVTAEDVAALALRLEQDDYPTPFAALKDWHFLRAIAFHNADLVEPYLYLLDIEAFDEG